MVCIPCIWWGSSEITLFNVFINVDTFIVSQACWLHSKFWRSLGIAARCPACTTGRNGEEVKDGQMSSSRNIFRENDSKITVTFNWENSHSLITGIPTTVRYPLERALTSASLGSHFLLLTAEAFLKGYATDTGLVGSSLLLYPSLQMVVQWAWLFQQSWRSSSLGTD